MEKSVLTSVFLPLSLAIIMFGMGLSLTLSDFKRILKFPKAVAIGLFCQLIMLPILAYFMILLFGLNGGLAVGVIVIAACPGGPTSNIITHISKGDTALSVTLTALSTLITIFTIPILVNLGIKTFMGINVEIELPLMDTFGALIVITILPVSIGMVVKKFKNQFAEKADKFVRIFSVVIFSALVLSVIVVNRANLALYFKEIGVVTVLLNLGTMLIAFYFSKILSLNFKQSLTISIESGIQNGTLALLITLTLIQGGTNEMSIAPAIYSLVMFFSGAFVMAYFGRKKDVV
jgi:bile acid:Na+ symporter, BASS family